MTITSLLARASEHAESGNVALETIGFGILAFVVFCALALVTVSYRNVANRHSHKAEAYARAHANDAAPTGHGH